MIPVSVAPLFLLLRARTWSFLLGFFSAAAAGIAFFAFFGWLPAVVASAPVVATSGMPMAISASSRMRE